MATLGIVEFLLHVMAEYYEEYDKAKKQVFADVHFLLFYTAILNALQSALLFNVVRRISKKMWVQTEELDVGHYVELREEFDAVRNDLEKLRYRRDWRKPRQSDGSDDAESPTNGFTADDCSEDSFELSAAGIAGAIQNIMGQNTLPGSQSKTSGAACSSPLPRTKSALPASLRSTSQIPNFRLSDAIGTACALKTDQRFADCLASVDRGGQSSLLCVGYCFLQSSLSSDCRRDDDLFVFYRHLIVRGSVLGCAQQNEESVQTNNEL